NRRLPSTAPDGKRRAAEALTFPNVLGRHLSGVVSAAGHREGAFGADERGNEPVDRALGDPYSPRNQNHRCLPSGSRPWPHRAVSARAARPFLERGIEQYRLVGEGMGEPDHLLGARRLRRRAAGTHGMVGVEKKAASALCRRWGGCKFGLGTMAQRTAMQGNR